MFICILEIRILSHKKTECFNDPYKKKKLNVYWQKAKGHVSSFKSFENIYSWSDLAAVQNWLLSLTQ